MNLEPFKILLIEDEIAHADWIDAILVNEDFFSTEIVHVQRLANAFACLAKRSFDVVLLDLSLPDSQGLESIVKVRQKAPWLPIIVLTSLNNRETAIAALRQGAQDYLIKGKFTGELLTISIRYAIERQKTETTLRQQALMKAMLDRIRNSLDLQEILQRTVTEVQQFLETDRVFIYRCLGGSSGKIIAQGVSDRLETVPLTNFSETELSLVVDIGDTCTSIRAVDDVKNAPGLDLTLLEHNGISSFLSIGIWQNSTYQESLLSNYFVDEVPDNSPEPDASSILNSASQERLWGVLIAHNCQLSRHWQQWEIEFLSQFTTQVSIAIQQSELYRQLKLANKELERLAILDGLTGLANRRYFDQVLTKEWQRLAREHKPLSLILCDIDFFKLYNDTYGHPAGDLALQTVAQILQTAIRRPADLVARYGGEEFALVLPDTDLQGALVVGNLVRHNLAQLELAHSKSQVSKYITLSIGLVTQIPDLESAPHTLLDRADRLLYKAKKAGRDRIAIEEETETIMAVPPQQS